MFLRKVKGIIGFTIQEKKILLWKTTYIIGVLFVKVHFFIVKTRFTVTYVKYNMIWLKNNNSLLRQHHQRLTSFFN